MDEYECWLDRIHAGIASDVSLLLANGHAHAQRYPIARVWWEARLARQRDVRRMSTEAALMHACIASVLAGGDELNKALERLERHGD